MKMSFTIPQLFYDIIARVLPGFIFLILLHFLTLDYNIDIMAFFTLQSSNIIISLGNSISFIMVCYFIGVLFSSIIICSKEKALKVHSMHHTFHEMYQYVRLHNESAGFRLIKLRAEAKFLEVSKAITISYAIIIILLILAYYFGLLHISRFNYGSWLLNLFVNIILAVLFTRQEEPAWRRYYENTVCIYFLLCENKKEYKYKKSIYHRPRII